MRSALVLLVVGLGLAAALQSRYHALLLYLWFALFRPQEWAWNALTSLHLSLVIGVALVVPSLLTGVWPNLSHPLSIETAAFMLLALFAQSTAVDQATGWDGIHLMGASMIVSLLLIRMTRNRARYLIVLAVISGSLAFYSAKYGVGYLIRGGAQFSNGTGGMFADNNDFAGAIARIIPLLVAVMQNVSVPWIKLGFAAAVPLSVLGVVGTFSRGGFVAVAAATLVLAVLQKRRILVLAGLAVVVVIGLAAIPIPEAYFQRLETIRTYQEVEDDSALSRLHFWQVAIDMAAAHPFGVGLRNYEVNYDRFDFLDGRYGRNRAVHSTHFQALAETGYLGFLVYFSLILTAIIISFRIRARAGAAGLDPIDRRFIWTTSNALIASIVAFVVGGSFGALLLNDLNWFTFGLIAALDYISRDLVAAADVRTKERVNAR